MWIGLPVAVAVVTVFLALLLFLSWFGRRSENWGATTEEAVVEMTGDEWLKGGPAVHIRMTRAVWVEARAEELWPWVAQMGRGAGWYSYDWIDNGGRPSARHIVSWIPDPRIGDATPIGYLRRVEPGRELVWWLKGVRFLGSEFRGVTLYRVIGEGDSCRLVVRIQADVSGLLARPARWLFRVLDGFMARRQIVGIKERAEQPQRRRRAAELAETGARDQYQLYHAIYASGEEAGVRGREGAASCRRAAIDDGVVEPAAD
jgi:hypothetical protein